MQTATPSTREHARDVRQRSPHRRPWWRRPIAAVPAIAGSLAVIVGVVFAFGAITAPSALAAVTEATERADGFTSGVVEFTLDVRQAQGLEEPLTVRGTYRYDGADSSFVLSVPGTDDPVELRRVDGRDYTLLDGIWFATSGSDSPDFDIREGFGIGTESIDPSAVLTLIRAADDVTETSSAGGNVTYSATLTAESLIGLGLEGLPMGISTVLSGMNPADDLPSELIVTIVTTDGVLAGASVEMTGDTAAAGYLDATVGATYSELGEPQSIVAPSEAEVVEAPPVDSEDFEDAAAILSDVESRRPGLCQEVEQQYFGDDPNDFDPTVIGQFADAMAACYADAGEPEAADAFRQLMGLISDAE